MIHDRAATFILLLFAAVPCAAASPFIPNRGQMDARVLYYATSRGTDLFLHDDGLTVRIHPIGPTVPSSAPAHVVRIRFGGDATPREVVPGRPLPTRYHFLRGSDPAEWRPSVPSYAEILYRDLRPGTDLRISLERDALGLSIETDAAIAPTPLEFIYEGADRVVRAADGSVRLETAAGALLHDPSAGWLARIDAPPDSPPERDNPGAVRWSTFLGGSLSEYGYSVAVRPSGEVVVAGIVQSPDFPVTPGAAYDTLAGSWDAFAAEIDSSGSVLNWATFLGGSQVDLAQAIALAPSGDLLLTGKTESADFPVTPGAFDPSYSGGSDAFVARLSADGSSVVWSSYLGGSSYEIAFGLIDDGTAGVIVGGYTSSPGYPVTPGCVDPTYNGGFDCFLTKLSAAGGTLVWSTFFGGRDDDRVYDIASNEEGEIFLTAWTQSEDFPTTAGAYDRTYAGGGDAYVARLSPAADQLRWSTFLGGSGLERAYGIAIAPDGDPVVAGWTESPLYPVTDGAFDASYGGSGDGFATRIESTGSALAWSSFVGGSFEDKCLEVVLDGGGNPLLTGSTASSDFPTTPDGFDLTYNGNGDAFAAMLHGQGSSLIWSSFLGGDSMDLGNSLAASAAPAIVLTGETESLNFPATGGSFDDTWNGQIDLFVTKIAARRPSDAAEAAAPADQPTRALSLAPNPFSGATTITLAPPTPGTAAVAIHDPAGRTVRILSNGRSLPDGRVALDWDGTDDAGRSLPAGIYFARPISAEGGLVRAIVLLRR